MDKLGIFRKIKSLIIFYVPQILANWGFCATIT